MTAADKAFESLQRRFSNLYRSLQARGGIAESDHPYLEQLCSAVESFRDDHADHVPAVAMEYQLLRWLGDNPRADAVLDYLLTLRPDDLELRRYHAERLRTENRYAEALAVLSGHEELLRKDPQGSLLLSSLLFAEEQYGEALAVLEAIDPAALESSPAMKTRVERDLRTRQDYVESWNREQEIRSTEAAANDLPRAEILLEDGRIEVELFENEAPNTVANFISLAESGFYNGTTFHRVINNFMAQGGDPNTKEGATGEPGEGSPGYTIADEHGQDTDRKHFTGSLAMAKTPAPNTAGSQFYLSHEPLPHLNGKHTVFGRVLSGLDLVRRIQQGDRILAVNVLRKRDHPYEPVTVADTFLPTPPPPVTGASDGGAGGSGSGTPAGGTSETDAPGGASSGENPGGDGAP